MLNGLLGLQLHQTVTLAHLNTHFIILTTIRVSVTTFAVLALFHQLIWIHYFIFVTSIHFRLVQFLFHVANRVLDAYTPLGEKVSHLAHLVHLVHRVVIIPLIVTPLVRGVRVEILKSVVVLVLHHSSIRVVLIAVILHVLHLLIVHLLIHTPRKTSKIRN
jgi:hypothetical protein